MLCKISILLLSHVKAGLWVGPTPSCSWYSILYKCKMQHFRVCEHKDGWMHSLDSAWSYQGGINTKVMNINSDSRQMTQFIR